MHTCGWALGRAKRKKDGTVDEEIFDYGENEQMKPTHMEVTYQCWKVIGQSSDQLTATNMTYIPNGNRVISGLSRPMQRENLENTIKRW